MVRERQTTKNEADEVPVTFKQITCSWEAEGNYIVRLVDGSGNVIREQSVSSGTSITFSDLDPRSIPQPVFCEIVDPNDLSCKKLSPPIICQVPPSGTPSPTPALPGQCEPCEEDEMVPRCAPGCNAYITKMDQNTVRHQTAHHVDLQQLQLHLQAARQRQL
ncbi:MAG: hypothetical protein UZ22_OP11002000738 [Microgenomates bacterium OLB23]|nr:MAG: hypothetical protein UZ22_OP11002000738 [Microgenomates bacterium OLB23]